MSDYELNMQEKFASPVVLREGESYAPIAWNDAFAMIAKALNSTESPDSPCFTSGRTSNEAAFLYQTFVRAYGTNNLPIAQMCHESSEGLVQTIGIGKGTVWLDDFNHADVIMVIGQNRAQITLVCLRHCEIKHRGSTIIHVNPLAEAGPPSNVWNYMKAQLKSTTLADLHLQVRIDAIPPHEASSNINSNAMLSTENSLMPNQRATTPWSNGHETTWDESLTIRELQERRYSKQVTSSPFRRPSLVGPWD